MIWTWPKMRHVREELPTGELGLRRVRYRPARTPVIQIIWGEHQRSVIVGRFAIHYEDLCKSKLHLGRPEDDETK